MTHARLQRRLLAESSLLFETALKLATAWESRTRRTFSPERNLQRTSMPLAVTERVRYVVTARKERKERRSAIYRCKGWHDADKCQSRDVESFRCGRKGHLARAYTVLPRCYAPAPIFGRNYCKGLFYLHYTPPPPPPPPAGRSSRFAVLQFCTYTRVASVEELYLCIKRVENSLRTGFGLFR